jgi:hypothetical protein
MMDVTLFLCFSLSLVFYDDYRSTACQHQIAIACLRFFCQIDHSLFLSPSLYLGFFSSLHWDIRHCYGRKYRATMFISLVPQKRKRERKKTYIEKRSSPYLCPYLSLIARLTFLLVLLINCMYAQYLSDSNGTLAVCICVAHVGL